MKDAKVELPVLEPEATEPSAAAVQEEEAAVKVDNAKEEATVENGTSADGKVEEQVNGAEPQAAGDVQMEEAHAEEVSPVIWR